MAPHLVLFMLVGGLVAAVVAATLTRTLYRDYGFVYLRSYFWAIVTFAAALVVSVASLYFDENLRTAASTESALAADVTYNVLSPTLHVIMLFLLVKTTCGLASRKPDRWVGYLITASVTVFLSWQAYQTLAAVSRSGTRIPSLAADVVFLAVTIASIAAFACLFYWAGRESNPRRRKSLKTLAGIVLILMGLAAAFGVVSFTGLVPETAILVVGSLFLVAFSLMPVLYLRWFMRALYGTDSGTPGERMHQEHPSGRYGLTNRETEIAELVGQGRSNRDIADLLFISQQTVKDHIHHIFQKTGVKNRVQLVNLLAGQTNDEETRS